MGSSYISSLWYPLSYYGYLKYSLIKKVSPLKDLLLNSISVCLCSSQPSQFLLFSCVSFISFPFISKLSDPFNFFLFLFFLNLLQLFQTCPFPLPFQDHYLSPFSHFPPPGLQISQIEVNWDWRKTKAGVTFKFLPSAYVMWVGFQVWFQTPWVTGDWFFGPPFFQGHTEQG